VTAPVDVAELRRLLAAATDHPLAALEDEGILQAQDCDLIVAAVNALPALLDRLEAAERERDEARSRISELESLVRWTHTTYCTEAWTTRGMHAPECLCAEAGVTP